MPHGHEDYMAQSPGSTVYVVQDLGELAARLGSPVVHDRRGNVLLIDDFEGSLSKCYYSTSAGGSVVISSKYARHGSFSCKLNTGAEDEDEAYIEWSLPVPVLSQIGLELSWNKSAGTKMKYLQIQVELLDGAHAWYGTVRYDQANHLWQYKSSAGVWTTFSSAIYYQESDFPFNCSKLVVDMVNKKFVRFITNDTEWSLADIDLRSVVSLLAGYLIPSVTLTTSASGATEQYIDSVIITQNEP